MCDQHCSVCDKGFSETCRLLTCPANRRAVSLSLVAEAPSPLQALARYVRDIDGKVFDQGRMVTIAEWSAVAEMVAALASDETKAAAPILALPAPVARQSEGNVVAFKPRGR